MSNLFFVGAGGFLGAILRHLAASAVQSRIMFFGFPLGTLTVNVLGCLLFGFMGAFATTHGLLTNQARLFVFTGFLGSFTTFSTFGNETVSLAQADQFNIALLYVALKLLLGFGAIIVGQMLGHTADRFFL